MREWKPSSNSPGQRFNLYEVRLGQPDGGREVVERAVRPDAQVMKRRGDIRQCALLPSGLGALLMGDERVVVHRFHDVGITGEARVRQMEHVSNDLCLEEREQISVD